MGVIALAVFSCFIKTANSFSTVILLKTCNNYIKVNQNILVPIATKKITVSSLQTFNEHK